MSIKFATCGTLRDKELVCHSSHAHTFLEEVHPYRRTGTRDRGASALDVVGIAFGVMEPLLALRELIMADREPREDGDMLVIGTKRFRKDVLTAFKGQVRVPGTAHAHCPPRAQALPRVCVLLRQTGTYYTLGTIYMRHKLREFKFPDYKKACETARVPVVTIVDKARAAACTRGCVCVFVCLCVCVCVCVCHSGV